MTAFFMSKLYATQAGGKKNNIYLLLILVYEIAVVLGCLVASVWVRVSDVSDNRWPLYNVLSEVSFINKV